MTAFAELIRERRHQLGLSQRGIARETGWSQQAISDIENGRMNPSRDFVLVLAEVLQVSDEEALRAAFGFEDDRLTLLEAEVSRLSQRVADLEAAGYRADYRSA